MAIAVLHHLSTAGNSSAATTSAVDTTGANLIVVAIGSYVPNGAAAITDSKSNTWTALTARASTNARVRLYYTVPSSVGSGHTFTSTATGAFPFCSVVVMSGAHASPFDQESGGNAASGTSSQPGSITPSENNCVLITGLNFYTGNTATINSSFTRQATNYGVSNNLAGGIAYKIQTTAGAENPTWSWTGSAENATAMASFKSAGSVAASLLLAQRATMKHLLNR